MRATGLVLVLLAAAGVTRAADEYELRGPAPTKGQVVTSKTTFVLKDATVTLKAAGMNIEAKQSMTATSEERVEALAVEGRQITKAQTKIVKDAADIVMTIGDNEQKETKDGELQGETLISERGAKGKWKHALVDVKPNDKQKKELDKRVGPESDDDVYPEGKFKVGHEWTVDAATLQRIFGGSITDLKGKLKLKFVKVETLDGQECAVIESSGKISGVAKEEEGTLDVEMEFKGTTWRSLKTGVDIKDKATGKMKMSGTLEMGGVKIEMVVDGPVSIESTTAKK
jgi:hypothetical protein